ncbi:MAG: hypothetical protein QXH21_07315 [Ignisphaera sp.]
MSQIQLLIKFSLNEKIINIVTNAKYGSRNMSQVEKKIKLREFKALSLAKLMSLSKKLKEKYPERVDRIEYITFELASKLQNLRTYTLTDYLFTLYLASREFHEFSELIPDEKTVEELLSESE